MLLLIDVILIIIIFSILVGSKLNLIDVDDVTCHVFEDATRKNIFINIFEAVATFEHYENSNLINSTSDSEKTFQLLNFGETFVLAVSLKAVEHFLKKIKPF